ncbi:DUF427 domain-containing protein [Nocardia vulneris]|uniref:DUF427 domain-containing protein n=1 Tax=Nocardia vulneris TaxID=1141657 RepID=A0ABR4Z6M4_9NOCA|nr:DUF427 domain-containing protein [Nocardia vulneris]KIA60956.1 hypothetical protein FG87_33980 [Nocardia vulneris]
MIEPEERRGRIEPGQKRVRVYLAGQLVADSSRPVLVWQTWHHPVYYLPVADLHAKLEPNGETTYCQSRGEATFYDVVVDGAVAAGAAARYLDPVVPELIDLVRLRFDLMDEWFEEDERSYARPRDPYVRVDILASSRHVRVEIDGVTVADSHTPHMVFETGRSVRYYLPPTDVRMDLLTPSAAHNSSPYRGIADYWSVRIGDNEYRHVAWSYRTPLPESQKIAGLIAFYNGLVDTYLDGELQERPPTLFE